MKKIINIIFITTILLILVDSTSFSKEKVHLVTTPIMGTDAIILESDGKFGMIDTGEDIDFPDGSNPKYPLRDGIIKDNKSAITDRVFNHLEKIGVKELEFIIITHTHSDHIGNASEIIKKIPTKKIYLKEYSDDRIYRKDRLWDNLYGYDKTIEAARKTRTKLIQNITHDLANINLNNISIKLLNYKNEYKDGKLLEVWDDNVNSILAIITANNKKLFFGGDLDNTDGREDKYASIIGKVDIMKLNHHVETNLSNSKNFIKILNPKTVIKTSPTDIEKEYKKWLDSKNINVIDTGRNDISAVVLEITDNEIKDISSEYGKYGIFKDHNKLKFKLWNKEIAPEGWLKNNGNWYYIENYGELKTGWLLDNNSWYYLDNNGELIKNKEYKIDNKTYYFKETGIMAKSEWIGINYFKKNGVKFNINYIIYISVVIILLLIMYKKFKNKNI